MKKLFRNYARNIIFDLIGKERIFSASFVTVAPTFYEHAVGRGKSHFATSLPDKKVGA